MIKGSGGSLAQRAWIKAVILGSLLAGCPDESSPGENDAEGDVGSKDAGPQTEKDAGGTAADPGAKVGTFTVRLVPPKPASEGSAASAGYTAISGKVFSGAVPEEVQWEVDAESGGCSLLKPRVPFCDPGCGQDVCVEDDKCAPNPSAVNVGTVKLSGLKASSGSSADINIEPIAASYSTPGGVTLAYPAFDEGGEIRLSASGGALDLDILSHGIAPLELTTTSFPLKPEAPLSVAWKAPGKKDISRIQLKLDISHHGGTKGKVECDVADTGSLSVPADLITRLLKLGVAGFPTVVVDRVSSGTTKTSAGIVELKVVSELEQAVQIDGLTSCDDNSDCPSGKSCQSDLSCK